MQDFIHVGRQKKVPGKWTSLVLHDFSQKVEIIGEIFNGMFSCPKNATSQNLLSFACIENKQNIY